MSAMGHLHYAIRKSRTIDGKKVTVYSLRWRETPLEPRRRKKASKPSIPETPEVESKTTEPAEVAEGVEA